MNKYAYDDSASQEVWKFMMMKDFWTLCIASREARFETEELYQFDIILLDEMEPW